MSEKCHYHWKLFVIVAIMLQCINVSSSLKCYSMPFPLMFGGLSGDTEFYALDTDISLNIVVAGRTSDPSIYPFEAGLGSYPLIILIDSQFNLNRWVKTYDTQNFYVKRV
jgi:hypothetical protein